MSKKMSARTIANAIKRGAGCTELKEEYSVSCEEIEEFIRKAFKKPDGLLSTLEKNEKKYQALQERKKPEEEEATQEIESMTPVPQQDPDLNELEKTLSDEAFRLDQEHKSIVRDRRAIVESLVETRREMKELLLKLKKTEKSIEEREAKANSLGLAMNDIAKQYAAVAGELESVREKIAERDKVIVLISKEGVLEVYQDDDVVAIEYDGWKERRDFMYDDESGLYDDLSKTQLGILAKLYIVKERFAGCRTDFELDGQFEALRRFLK